MIPAIELGLMALAAVATIAVGIYNSCNSSSKVSMPELNIADKVEAKKKNIETDLILELFKGIVTIQARIQAREAAKQELLNSIGSASGAMSASCISATINVVQDNIAELKTEQGQEIGSTASQSQTTEVSGSVAISNDGPIIPPLIPPAIDDGPITPPLIPPAIPDAGQITPPLIPPVIDAGQITPPLIPPQDDGPIIPPLIPPALKELEDYILRMGEVGEVQGWLVGKNGKVNWKRIPNFGHSFETHGQGAKNTRSLVDRAKTPNKYGQLTPQGQWLDNQKAAEFLSDYGEIPYATPPKEIDLPEGMAQVILPSGEIVAATKARIVINSKTGKIRSAIPIE